VKLQSKEVTLPCTQVKTTLYWYHYKEMALLLLTYPALMQSDNLLFPKDTPYGFPPGQLSEFLDDLDSGTMYKDAHEQYCLGQDNAVLNMHVMSSDKTHLANKGKLTLEPVMFTFGWFKRFIRNQPRANMPLGYLPNLYQLAPHASATAKASDLQYCLGFVLAEYVQHQHIQGGINWPLVYCGDTFSSVSMQIPLALINGDTEGHDKFLGKKMDYKTCRNCNSKWDDFDNPDATFTYTKSFQIRQLREEASKGDSQGSSSQELVFLGATILSRVSSCYSSTMPLLSPPTGRKP